MYGVVDLNCVAKCYASPVKLFPVYVSKIMSFSCGHCKQSSYTTHKNQCFSNACTRTYMYVLTNTVTVAIATSFLHANWYQLDHIDSPNYIPTLR